jgi:maltose alpha-D-glucosyltransferase/alpha-amylase
MDPVYGYQAVNVEAQMRNPSSFLQWVRRMLQVRRQHPVFGTGKFETISVDNPSVLAYLRSDPERLEGEEGAPERMGDTVLCVQNLSRFAQPVELPLSRFEGRRPIELLGRVPFPPIGQLPYLLTLAPYGFLWFDLSQAPAEVPPGGPPRLIATDRPPAEDEGG